MAFRAFIKKEAKMCNYSKEDIFNAFQAACFNFFLQVSLTGLVMSYVPNIDIVMPSRTTVLGIRFIMAFCMHLEYVDELYRGLRMMKYSTDHYDKFSYPIAAFMVGIFRFTGIVFCELACLIRLGSKNNELDVVAYYLPFDTIALIPKLYSLALSYNHPLKQNSNKPLIFMMERWSSKVDR
jgi:uncharacterized membrane protein